MQKLIHRSKIQENILWFKASCCFKTLIETLQIYIYIVISKLFLDNEIIALIKIPYVARYNNIYYFI